MPPKPGLNPIPQIKQYAIDQALEIILDRQNSLAPKKGEGRSVLGYWITGYSTAFTRDQFSKCQKDDIRQLIWQGATLTEQEKEQLNRFLEENKAFDNEIITILRTYQQTQDHIKENTPINVADEANAFLKKKDNINKKHPPDIVRILGESFTNAMSQRHISHYTTDQLQQITQTPSFIIKKDIKKTIIDAIINKKDERTNQIIFDLASQQEWIAELPEQSTQLYTQQPLKYGGTIYSNWLSYLAYEFSIKTAQDESTFRRKMLLIQGKDLNQEIKRITTTNIKDNQSTSKRISTLMSKNKTSKKQTTEEEKHPLICIIENRDLKKLIIYLSIIEKIGNGINIPSMGITINNSERKNIYALSEYIVANTSGEDTFNISEIIRTWMDGNIQNQEETLLRQDEASTPRKKYRDLALEIKTTVIPPQKHLPTRPSHNNSHKIQKLAAMEKGNHTQ